MSLLAHGLLRLGWAKQIVTSHVVGAMAVAGQRNRVFQRFQASVLSPFHFAVVWFTNSLPMEACLGHTTEGVFLPPKHV